MKYIFAVAAGCLISFLNESAEKIAILIADLSGYSALTETHGAVSAADLIDKYLGIVEDCLVGDSKHVDVPAMK